MHYRVLFCLLAVALAAAGSAPVSHAQIQAGMPQAPGQLPAQTGTIRVSTGLVLIPVSVTNAAGQAVKNLRMEDFLVLENGAPVTIERMGEPGLAQLDMVLAFDLTASTRPQFRFEQEAATSFLKAIFRPGDEVSIIAIAAKPSILLEHTGSVPLAFEGLRLLQPTMSATAFFDSIIQATQAFAGPIDPNTRRVLIVLSDGEDNLSTQKLPDALRAVQQSDCIFYSINPGGPSIRLNMVSLRGQQGMEALAEQTGGFAFLAEKVEELTDIYGRIAAELQAQYLLSYYSPDLKTDSDFRTIQVRIPTRPELRVRARQGYYPKLRK